MRVVLDTNIWISALLWKGEARTLILFLIKRSCKIVSSAPIIVEIYFTLQRYEKLIKRLTALAVSAENAIENVCFLSSFVSLSEIKPLVQEDPDDDMILATAITVHARVIITYDQHLLKMKTAEGIDIVSPKEFMVRFAPSEA